MSNSIESDVHLLKRRLKIAVQKFREEKIKVEQEIETIKFVSNQKAQLQVDLTNEKLLNDNLFLDLSNMKKLLSDTLVLTNKLSSNFTTFPSINLTADLSNELSNDLATLPTTNITNESTSNIIKDLSNRLNELNELLDSSIDRKHSIDRSISPNRDKSLARSKMRRSTSVYIEPQHNGTSLLRKSTDIRKSTSALPNDLYISDDERGSPLYSHEDSFSNHMPFHENAVDTDQDDKLDDRSPNLFEHFLVIGPTIETANQFATYIETGNDSLSTRLIRKIGGFLSSSNRLSSTNTNDVKIDSKIDSKSSSKLDSNIDSKVDSKISNKVDFKIDSQIDNDEDNHVDSKVDTNITSSSENKSNSQIENQLGNSIHINVNSLEDNSIGKSIDKPIDTQAVKTIENSIDLLIDKEVNTRDRSISLSTPLIRPLFSGLFSPSSLKTPSFSPGRARAMSKDSDITTVNEIDSSPRNRNLPSISNLLSNVLFSKQVVSEVASEIPNESNKIDELNNNSNSNITTNLTTNITANANTSVNSNVNNNQNSLIDLKLNENKTIATTNPSILFRFPDSVDPPPSEVSDFCLPLGAQIRRLPNASTNNTSDNTRMEILYGNSQSKRSGRCFVFVLEDKNNSSPFNESQRLYGICVIHSRLLSNNDKDNKIDSQEDTKLDGKFDSQLDSKTVIDSKVHDFESIVCYTFITRYPFFSWFFQIIFDILTVERLDNLTMNTLDSIESNRLDRSYVPIDRLIDVLNRLASLKPPSSSNILRFEVSLHTPTIEYQRPNKYTDDVDISDDEDTSSCSNWALPILFNWLSADLIVWLLGLLLIEAKVLVIGQEPGIVSCSVLGLKSLLAPLAWAGPLIPVIPLKHAELIEAPVPLLAGLVVDYTSTDVCNSNEAESILFKCNDLNNGTVTAVLDTCRREVYLSACHQKLIQHLLLPGAQRLIDQLKDNLSCSPKSTLPFIYPQWPLGVSQHRTGVSYNVNSLLHEETNKAIDLISVHVSSLLSMAIARNNKPNDQADMNKSNNRIRDPAVVYTHSNRLSFSDDELDDDEDIESEESIKNNQLLANFYTASVVQPSPSKNTTFSGILSSFISNQSTTKDPVVENNIVNSNSNNVISEEKGLIYLSKQKLIGDSDEFINKFLQTQMFAEHTSDETIISPLKSLSSSITTSPIDYEVPSKGGLVVVGLSKALRRLTVKVESNQIRLLADELSADTTTTDNS